MTGLEVAQATRHEARGILGNCNSLLALSRKDLHSTGFDKGRLIKRVDQIGGELLSISRSLDAIRDATRVNFRKPDEQLGLLSVWKEAVGVVQGKLYEANIQASLAGQDAIVFGNRDTLRHAFLNLILNSIDAFSRRRRVQNRDISLTISRKAKSATLRYRDNATGIDLASLGANAYRQGEVSVGRLIFEPGVTSKPTGSGYGLYLVRRILEDHGGSIDLVDYRNGVVFDLQLPLRDNA